MGHVRLGHLTVSSSTSKYALTVKTNAPYFWPVVFVFGVIAGAFATYAVRFAVSPEARGLALQFITAGIAASAFALALRTYKFNDLKSKTDLFTSFHEKLIEAEAQRGRSILAVKLKEPEDVGSLSSADFVCVNRALALYETLAMYMIKGNLREEDVLETWGLALYRRRNEIRWFMEYRDATHQYVSWPYLKNLLDRMTKRPPEIIQPPRSSN